MRRHRKSGNDQRQVRALGALRRALFLTWFKYASVPFPVSLQLGRCESVPRGEVRTARGMQTRGEVRLRWTREKPGLDIIWGFLLKPSIDEAGI